MRTSKKLGSLLTAAVTVGAMVLAGCSSSQTSSLDRGFVVGAGDAEFLAGPSPDEAAKVRRGSLPVIAPIELKQLANGKLRVSTAVSTHQVIEGVHALGEGAVNKLSVELQVLDGNEGTDRRNVVFSDAKSFDLDPGSGLDTNVSFAVPADVAAVLADMSKKRRNQSVLVIADHRINLTGLEIGTHKKVAAATVAASKSRSQGQGIHLTVVNNSPDSTDMSDYEDYKEYVRVVANPESCMFTGGEDGSDFTALNGTYAWGDSVETYLEATQGLTKKFEDYDGQDAKDIVEALSEDVTEDVVPALTASSFNPASYFVQAMILVMDAVTDSCATKPSAFSMHVHDFNGNATTQPYIITDQLDDGLVDGCNADASYGGVDWSMVNNTGGEEANQFLETLCTEPLKSDASAGAGVGGDNGDAGLRIDADLLSSGDTPSWEFTIRYGGTSTHVPNTTSNGSNTPTPYPIENTASPTASAS